MEKQWSSMALGTAHSKPSWLQTLYSMAVLCQRGCGFLAGPPAMVLTQSRIAAALPRVNASQLR